MHHRLPIVVLACSVGLLPAQTESAAPPDGAPAVSPAGSPVGPVRVGGQPKSLAGLVPFANASGDALVHTPGRWLIVDFMASWCGPCMANLPKAEELGAEFKDAGVDWIYLMSQSKEALDDFVEEYQPKLPVWADHEEVLPPRFGVPGFPWCMVIDPGGKIAALTHPHYITAEVLGSLPESGPLDLPVREPMVSPDPLWDRELLKDQPAGFSMVLLPSAADTGSVWVDPAKGHYSGDGMTLQDLLYLCHGVQPDLHGVPEGVAFERRFRFSLVLGGLGEVQGLTALADAACRAEGMRVVLREEERDVLAIIRCANPGPPESGDGRGLLPRPSEKFVRRGGGTWDDQGMVDMKGVSPLFMGRLVAMTAFPDYAQKAIDATGIRYRFPVRFQYTPDDTASLREALRSHGLDFKVGLQKVRMLELTRL